MPSKLEIGNIQSLPINPRLPITQKRIVNLSQFETMDEETGTIAPDVGTNQDTLRYRDEYGCRYKMDHTVLKFTMSEGRQLARAIANYIRVQVLKQLHKQHRDDTMRLQEELDRIRLKDSKNPLWALHHSEYYPAIPWKRIAKEQMQGRTESECKVFWNGHVCCHNPTINRSRTWPKQSNESLKEIVEAHHETMWERIAEQHNVRWPFHIVFCFVV